MFELQIFPDARSAELACARMVIDQVRSKPDSVLGLATGKTMINVYDILWKWENDLEINFSRVTTFNLDEYLGVNAQCRDSFHAFMRRNFFSLLNQPPSAIHILDGAAADPEEECRRFEFLIRQSGGIDLQLLGLGRNGHIGFNEPGSGFDSRTRVVDLSENTRLYYLKNLIELREVPKQALTMGIATIMEARNIVLLVTGAAKAEALYRVVKGPVDEKVPGSVLFLHPAAKILADREAAGEILASEPKVIRLERKEG